MSDNADPNCIFCKIVAGEIPCAKILDTDDALAFLDINPLAPGHTLLIPKTHAVRLENLSASQSGALLRHIPALAKAVRQATGCAGYNILQNNGKVAHQDVMHVHFHIIPRFEDDNFSFSWPAGSYEDGQMDEMLGKIRGVLEN